MDHAPILVSARPDPTFGKYKGHRALAGLVKVQLEIGRRIGHVRGKGVDLGLNKTHIVARCAVLADPVVDVVDDARTKELGHLATKSAYAD